MNAVKLLTDLGFVGSTVVSDAKGKVLVKVWTAKGWAYERFHSDKRLENEITAWSRTVEPGTWL